MSENKGRLVNKFDGTQIPIVTNGSDNSKHWLLMIHGLGTSKDEYLDFYRVIADMLAKHKIASMRFDCRGHGESKAPSREFVYSNNIKDALCCLDDIYRRNPKATVDILGTSFGAPTALFTASLQDHRIRHVYLLAPALDLERLYLNPVPERMDKYARFIERVVDKAKRFKIDDKISFGIENVIEFSFMNVSASVQKLQKRLTVIHGDADTMIPVRLTEMALSQSPAAKLHIFKKMDHGFMALGDESGDSEESKRNLKKIAEILANDR